MLTSADIRKNKSQAASLLIFTLIAAMLLNIGLALFFGVGTIFDSRAEANHMAHYTAVYDSRSDSIESGMRFLENYPGAVETETLNAVGGMGDYYIDGVKNNCFLFLSPAAKQQKMDTVSPIGDYLPLSGDLIYIPYFILQSGNYKIGDEFKLLLSGIELSFSVAGGTEEIMFGAQFNTIYRFYISNEKFAEIEGIFPENGITLLSARLQNAEDEEFLQADYKKAVSTEGLYYDLIYGNAKQARTMVPQIAAIVITAFSIILLGVCMIVIRFRIVNSIEENIVNIGTQKAVGFLSFQIILSIVLQFASVAFAGCIAGIALSQAVLPAIVKILEPMIALIWNPGFSFVAASIAFFLVLFAVSLISFLSARKINRLLPLVALRKGTKTHSFKKNVFPLEKTRGPLDLLFALKQLSHKKMQAAAISIIVAAVTMASVAGISVYHNMSGGRDNFARALFGEMPDVNYMLKDGAAGDSFKEKLLERSEVRKAFGYETSFPLLAGEIGISTIIAEDCSLLEGNMIIEGRYPKHNNEIALGTAVSKVAGKKPGDMIMVKSGDNEKEYIVTGIVQYMNSNGFNGIITGDALRGILPDYKFAGYNVYVNEGANVKAHIESVEKAEGDIFESIMHIQDQMETMMESMSGVFAAVAAGILAVTVFVVALVLYMVIKTTILQRKRELGVQKALGFTAFALMNQIALNMTPSILAGVVLGGLAGAFGFNPMMGALLSGMGIVKVSLPIPVILAAAVCAAIVIIAYAVSIAVARRIRKISAYSMITEM